MPHPFRAVGALLIAAAAGSSPALAERIKNPTAIFNGLDKISGKIQPFEVGIGETVQFGALQVTPRVCYSRSASETPQTTSFIEVDEVGLDKQIKRIFTGWMFASSPGLHAVDHPVYDIWLTDCKGGVTADVAPPTAEVKPAKPKQGKGQAQPEDETPADPDFNELTIDPNAPVD